VLQALEHIKGGIRNYVECLFTQLLRRLANFAGKVDPKGRPRGAILIFPKGSSGEGKLSLGRLLQPLQVQLLLITPLLIDWLDLEILNL
jgi:hypothetical protein